MRTAGLAVHQVLPANSATLACSDNDLAAWVIALTLGLQRIAKDLTCQATSPCLELVERPRSPALATRSLDCARDTRGVPAAQLLCTPL